MLDELDDEVDEDDEVPDEDDDDDELELETGALPRSQSAVGIGAALLASDGSCCRICLSEGAEPGAA